jgi:hypothetical protein
MGVWAPTSKLALLGAQYLAGRAIVRRKIIAILGHAEACGSACKKDPLSGVIGVQKGPLISMV